MKRLLGSAVLIAFSAGIQAAALDAGSTRPMVAPWFQDLASRGAVPTLDGGGLAARNPLDAGLKMAAGDVFASERTGVPVPAHLLARMTAKPPSK